MFYTGVMRTEIILSQLLVSLLNIKMTASALPRYLWQNQARRIILALTWEEILLSLLFARWDGKYTSRWTRYWKLGLNEILQYTLYSISMYLGPHMSTWN